MAYTLFGGGPADVTTNSDGNVIGGVEFRVYTAPSGGVRVTDLRSHDGEPLPGIVTSQVDDGDAADRGRIKFQAPDSFYALYLDRGYGDRWQVVPSKLGETVAASIDASNTALAQSSQAVDAANQALAVARAQVDVRTFGAVGDGYTDDTAAFRAAIEYIDLNGGGTLFVPPLRYRLADHVPLCSNLYVEGWGATFVKHTGPRESYAYFSALSRGQTGYGSGCRNVRVAGITFTGDFATSVDTCGFALHHAQDVTIEQCSFVEVQSGGHCIDLAGCNGVTVRQCRFIGHKEAPAGSAYRRAEAIQIDVSTKGALSVDDEDGSFDGKYTRDVTVEGCSFETLTLNGVDYPAPNPLGSHTVREGAVAENITLRNCTIDRLTVDTTSAWRGGVHFAGVRGLTVENNTFRCPANARVIAVYTATTGTPASHDPNLGAPPTQAINPVGIENVRIAGNRIIVSSSATTSFQEVILISGDAAKQATAVEVAGNTISQSAFAGTAIYIIQGNNVRVTDNAGDGVHIGVRVTGSKDAVSRGNSWRCGQRSSYSYNGQNAERYQDVQSLSVSDLYVVNPLDAAVSVGNASTEVTITSVTSIGSQSVAVDRGDAVRIEGAAKFSITNCKLSAGTATYKREGIKVYGTGTTRGLITSNVITGFDSLVTTSGVTEVTATGNI